ncbi:hypothetical protein IKS38_06650 [bacterium]|nr:hypothetical protein [bacterium]
MRKINASLLVLIIFGALSLFAKKERTQTVQFGNMKATYFGNGTLEAIPVMGTDVWDIRVTDAGVFYLDGTLTVAPQQKYAKTPANVKIREIYCDGILKSLNVTFPPGLDHAGFVQDVTIIGNIRYLTIVGGDLGSPLGAGGMMRIKGRITNLNISGKVFQNTEKQRTEYWGGNVWADLVVKDQLQYTSIKGGNLYFDPATGGTHGIIESKDNMRTFTVASQIVKDKYTKEAKCYGGVVNADIVSLLDGLKDMQIKGGAFFGGMVRSKFLKTFNVTAFKTASSYPIERGSCGIRDAYFAVRDYNKTTLNYTNFFVKTISVKDADIINSTFTCQGNISEMKVNSNKSLPYGMISNCVVRAGYSGQLLDYNMPEISLYRTVEVSTNAVMEIPFVISNLVAESEYELYLPNKDRAWHVRLSDGTEEYSGPSKIALTGSDSFSGKILWDPSEEELYFGKESSIPVTNVTLRVLRKGSPELFLDVKPRITVLGNSDGTMERHYPTVFTYSGIVETVANEKGQINSLSCSKAYDSLFAGGTIINDLSNPAHASYIGNVNTAKFKLNALGNMILSKAKTAISPKTFDYQNNEVWNNGQRRDK